MGAAQYGSDLIVDVLRALGIEYAALNPGATFRGLHDSLVNYGGNERPGIIQCCHEEIAVAVAHGYAKAAGSRWRRSCTTSSAFSTPAWRSRSEEHTSELQSQFHLVCRL